VGRGTCGTRVRVRGTATGEASTQGGTGAGSGAGGRGADQGVFAAGDRVPDSDRHGRTDAARHDAIPAVPARDRRVGLRRAGKTWDPEIKPTRQASPFSGPREASAA